MTIPKFDLRRIPVYSRLSVRHRQIVKIIGGGFAGLTLVVVASSFMGGDDSKVASSKSESHIQSIAGGPGSESVNDQQVWMAQEGKRLDNLSESQAKLQQAIQDLVVKGQIGAATPAASAAGQALPALSGALPTGPAASASSGLTTGAASNRTPLPIPSGAAGDTAQIFPKQVGLPNSNAPGANLGMRDYPPGTPNRLNGTQVAEGNRPGSHLVAMSVQADEDQPPPADKGKNQQAQTVPKVDTNFIPVSFTRGVMLGGLDAATGGQAPHDPIPVLIQLVDNAFLPNGFRSKVKSCFVIAHGFGDLSSERAYLRLVNLSCVLKDGQAVEVNVKGSVFGEDGKNGVRGRVVTKQGQVLANAALAGIASGIGHTFGQQGTTISVSPLGTTQTNPTDAQTLLKNGVLQGASNALDRLAQYYINRADQMYPVIEVDAGRMVDVVFTQGVRVEALPSDVPNASETSSLPQRAIDRSDSVQALANDH